MNHQDTMNTKNTKSGKVFVPSVFLVLLGVLVVHLPYRFETIPKARHHRSREDARR